MGETVRLRVVFEDAGILRGWQRRGGLQRCWLQLRRGVVTIAELAAHLQMAFDLHSSCPHGLIISMDGFVLPSFESTCILKDKDTIMIKKNGVMFHDAVQFCGSQNQELVLQSRHISAFDNRNLSIMDPQVDSQGDEIDTVIFNRSTIHIETPSKRMNEHCKRKRSNELQGSNNTLAIKDSQGDLLGDEENVGLHGSIAHKEITSNEMLNAKRKKKHFNELQTSDTLENKVSQADSQAGKGDLGLPISRKEASSSDTIKLNRKRKHFDKLQGSDDTLAIKDSQRNSQRNEEDNVPQRNTPHKEATSSEMMNVKYKRKHSNKLQAWNESMGIDDGHVYKNDANGDARKVPSRSARRKKAKRIWYRKFCSKKEKKLIEIEIPEGDNRKKTQEYANTDQNTKVDKENADPVIVRPGFIRFGSSDTCVMRADEPVENFQWNGISTKKKGQKWGRENTFSKRNDDISSWLSYGESSNAMESELVEVSNEKFAVVKMEAYEEAIVNHVEPAKECNGNSVGKEFEAVKELIDFEGLLPLTRLPEDGDVLAYRVVQMSSSWCPELSPFRVGRVSSYDCSSSKIILLPLPKYPLISEEMSEEGQESRSPYKEDGTLEADFTSLVDVRLFIAVESIKITPSTTPIEEMQNALPVNNQETHIIAPVESASYSTNKMEINSNLTANSQLMRAGRP